MKRLVTLIPSKTSVILKSFFENKCRISIKVVPKFCLSLALSILFFPFRAIESIVYARRIKKATVYKPIYVVGHWRTGTTLLHYIINKDPNLYCISPLMGYGINASIIKAIINKPLTQAVASAREMDNMRWDMTSPFEDYVFFSLWYTHSTWTYNLYPHDRYRYLDYAFVDEMPEKAQRRWFRAYDKMLRKCYAQIPANSSMLLKSPDATARVKFLHDKYTDSVFLCTYRNPYTVIRSTIHLLKTVFGFMSLQKPLSDKEIEDFVFFQFKRICLKYFEDFKEIDSNRIIEIKFEEFEKDPMPMLEEAYAKFGWDWEAAKPAIQAYWDSLAGYQKNVFEYSPQLIKRVNDELGFYFEHYGYPMMEVPEDTITM